MQRSVHIIDIQDHHDTIIRLLRQLNPDRDEVYLRSTIGAMNELPGYLCFGLFVDDQLVGIASGWTTVRIYCGRQLELDNVVIDEAIQSQGHGGYFMDSIEAWASSHGYKRLALNTYVQNARSHKFYFNRGYTILGYHFEKELS